MYMRPGSYPPNDFSIVGIYIQVQFVNIGISVIPYEIQIVEEALAVTDVSIEFSLWPVPICTLRPFVSREVIDERPIPSREVNDIKAMSLLSITPACRILDALQRFNHVVDCVRTDFRRRIIVRHPYLAEAGCRRTKPEKVVAVRCD